MPLDPYGSTKYMDALDIAAAEGFEWDYENAEDYDLYEAIEANGYVWNERGNYWIGPDSDEARAAAEAEAREVRRMERAINDRKKQLEAGQQTLFG